ncbi:L-serine ammonia-lyase [Microbulbifer thermotolerans]|uniref:L-serine dehydratase n=1 Tax=Microbulbifer thermotolerans TaxID=252514 RepID=A0A143HL33_MICTH|nr:L-serine ammonia-lyase [Microbulbifer thermotolerans]AMX02424.1 L-serine ammonia-lyase [Microbulbifer thermotolerans]MCX2780985.1 L-serine ammonia-lyase [Microbulbifer thermotolerans]MCX2784569.1 L-serine ammonia-lyase [Microbulbifer thermotolerans]MCX2795223.1 L-serine ammonia-lyase [Microbulbifer thermotolerans]MCX2802844.1 L-serine ammonia-lyase [Microbulbifer thermotolerans]
MSISVFELFKIGVGPSSSHTVGPMVAARQFVHDLDKRGQLQAAERVQVHLYGSLALTGVGHGTDMAVLMGLLGEAPDTIDVDSIDDRLEAIARESQLALGGSHPVTFDRNRDLIFHGDQFLPQHANGMTCQAYRGGELLFERSYFSIGGGFVLSEEDFAHKEEIATLLPFDFSSARQLMELCDKHGWTIAELAMANEKAFRSEREVTDRLWHIWQVMDASIQRGCRRQGILPGGLNVRRRAAELYRELSGQSEEERRSGLAILDWVSLYALAVNEENAARGRIVTAPTNGAAGVIPAVIAYYVNFVHDPAVHGDLKDQVVKFLLTAGAIGMLYKKNASISAAEVGCQGEIGVACSMASAGLAAVQGGSNQQIENAAEIGMEHNLGLTCDPIGGLVQVPCIERNTMGSVKAINAARLALRGDGAHVVPLDSVIETMRQTGIDMQSKYKETALGGLAVNAVNC